MDHTGVSASEGCATPRSVHNGHQQTKQTRHRHVAIGPSHQNLTYTNPLGSKYQYVSLSPASFSRHQRIGISAPTPNLRPRSARKPTPNPPPRWVLLSETLRPPTAASSFKL